MKFLQARWPFLLLILAPLVVLWPAVFGGKTIGPWDNLAAMAGHNETPITQPWDVLQTDSVLQFYPWRDMVFEAWREGEMPLWNPYSLAGTPLLANSQSAGFYPLHIAMGVLHVPTGLAITLLAWIHLALAGLGTYLLLRQLKASETGSLLGGLGFGLSSFMISWTGLSSVITTCCWIPFVLYWVVLLFQDPQSRRLATAGLGLVVGLMFLGGHLQFAAYGAIALVVVAVTLALMPSDEFTRKQRLVPLGLCFASLGIGLMLAAIQILPALEFSKSSHRAGSPTAEGYAAYAANALKPSDLLAWPSANVGGSPLLPALPDEPLAKNPAQWQANRGPEKAPTNFAERALSVGPILFVLLGMTFFVARTRRAAAPFLALLIVALLIGMGTIVTQALYFGFPGWSSTGSPGRVIVLFVLASCVIGGLGFDALREVLKQDVAQQMVKKGALIGLAILGLWVASAGFLSGVQIGSFALLILALLVPVLVYFLGSKSTDAQSAVTLSVLCILLALVTHHGLRFGTKFKPLVDVPQNNNERFAVYNSNWNLFVQPRALIPPNLLSLRRRLDLGGYDSLISRDTVSFLREINLGRDPAPPENGNMMFLSNPRFNQRNPEDFYNSLANAGVSNLVVPEQRPDGSIMRSYVVISTKGRAYTEKGRAKIIRDGFDRMILEAEGPGSLWIKDAWMPGWTASVNGQFESVKQDGFFRKIDGLAQGKNRVVLTYKPPGFINALTWSIGGFIVIFSLFMVSRKSISTASKT